MNLTSVEAKLSRAAYHSHLVKSEVRIWMETQPYSVFQEVNSDCTHYKLVTKIRGGDPDLLRWTLAIGDCLYSLRCALDHTIFAVAVHESGIPAPPKEDSLMFPICDRPEDFLKSLWRLGDITSPVVKAVESVQPYNRTHPRIPPPLSILRNLNNADKHKLIRFAFSTPMQGDIGFSGPQHPKGSVQIVANYGEIKDGVSLAEHIFEHPAPNMKYDRIDVELSVAIWHGKRDEFGPEWSARSDFAALLSILISEVKFAIDTVVRSVVR